MHRQETATMPLDIRRLAAEEVAKYFPRGGLRLPQQEYIDALRSIKPGEAAEVVRGNLTSRAFKRRLTLAAKHLGLALKYAKEASDEVIRFQVREPRKARRALPAAGASSAPRRRGRPPKQTARLA